MCGPWRDGGTRERKAVRPSGWSEADPAKSGEVSPSISHKDAVSLRQGDQINASVLVLHMPSTARLLPPSIALGLRANLLGRTQPSLAAFSPHPSPPDPGTRPASLSPTEFLPSRPPESPQCLWWEAGLWSTLGVCGRWGQSCLWEGRRGREKDRPGSAVCRRQGSRLTARPGCSASQAPGRGAPLSTLSPDTKQLPPVPKP